MADCEKRRRMERQSSYSSDALKAALIAINEGLMTVSEAARSYNIPYTTIKSRLKKGDNMLDTYAKGPPTKFNADQEQTLVQWIKKRHMMGATVTQKQLCTEACKLNNETADTLISELTKGWVMKFLGRHPHAPLVINAKRKLANSDTEISKCLSDLSFYMRKFGNCGPNRFFLENRKSIYSVCQLSLGEVVDHSFHAYCHMAVKVKNLSSNLFISFNCLGTYVQPFWIMNPREFKSCTRIFPESVIKLSEEKEESLFLVWLKHFVLTISSPRPVLLLLTINPGLLDVHTLEFAEEHNLLLYYVPPNIHQLQPALLEFAKPFQILSEIRDLHSLGQSLVKLWLSLATPTKAGLAFSNAGLVPLKKEWASKLSSTEGPQFSSNDFIEGSKVSEYDDSFIKGYTHALEMLKSKCFSNSQLQSLENLDLIGQATSSDPMLMAWKVLEDERRKLVSLASGISSEEMKPTSSETLSNYETNRIPSHEACTQSIPSYPSCSSHCEISVSHKSVLSPVKSSLDQVHFSNFESINLLNRRESFENSNGDFTPSTDRYKREINFGPKTATNLEQRCMEIQQQYEEQSGTIPLTELHIDAIDDLGL